MANMIRHCKRSNSRCSSVPTRLTRPPSPKFAPLGPDKFRQSKKDGSAAAATTDSKGTGTTLLKTCNCNCCSFRRPMPRDDSGPAAQKMLDQFVAGATGNAAAWWHFVLVDGCPHPGRHGHRPASICKPPINWHPRFRRSKMTWPWICHPAIRQTRNGR